MAYFVYIIQSQYDGSFYIGSTQNLSERLNRHNQGRSNYTRPKRPWILVYCEQFPDRPAATRREKRLKNQKSKSFIQNLIANATQPE
ncbi:MAG: GIY-YIG nuclease family protein [Thermodesulfobacteriota bacterium]